MYLAWVDLMPEAKEGCTCKLVHLNVGRSPVGKSISDDCPEHGVGTEYRRERAEFWNERLRKLREKRPDG